MMYDGKIMFFNSLVNTLREGCEYRYPTQEERNKNKNLGDTPLDKNNHLMDCLRYICQELPYNYIDMKRMSYNNYLKFFDGIKNDKDIKNEALSFSNLIDIIKAEYDDEILKSNSNDVFGGYKI